MAHTTILARLHEAIRVPDSRAAATTNERPYGSKLSNEDLEPSPPGQRAWSAWTFFAFQFSIAFSPTTYNIGSSLYSIGLNWWTIVLASFAGTGLCCAVLFLNSRGPAWYHVGFPVYVRACAGVYGSFFFLFIRMIVAVFYEGTQTYYAARLLDVALRCVFGAGWTTGIPNRLPAGAGSTSSQMLAFFLTWLLQLPSAWLHPSKAGPLFVVKSALSPLAYIVTMVWAVTAFGGVDLGLGRETVAGGELGWSFMKAINTVVSGVVPPMVNIADLARYANQPRDVLPMMAGLFVSKPAVILVGLFTTAAGLKRFGVASWNQWDFYTLVLDHYWSPGVRAAVFLGAGVQAFATVVTNISSNAIPIGCDLAGLLPRYFTIVRGQVLCNLLVWAVVPWRLVSSARSFLTFLGSYLCFVTPVVAAMIVDYWAVRRGNLHVPSLYVAGDPAAPYWYAGGVNPRAYAAWAAGVVLVISGIAGAIRPGAVSATAVHVYDCGFVLSFACGALVYYLACRLFPPKIYPDGAHARDSQAWEAMVPTEGFFLDDDHVPAYVNERTLLGQEPGAMESGGVVLEGEKGEKGEKL
ncbi:putative allantoin permease [Xylariomycetidae sp. FL0641]|nr:putative allantoin permease [Xylariomycetidae sp. FL0641]